MTMLARLLTTVLAGSTLMLNYRGSAVTHPNGLVNRSSYRSFDPYWVKARAEVDGEMRAARRFESMAFLPIRPEPRHHHGGPREKLIALTFDDGPHLGLTEPLLEVLRKEHVRATFFVVGAMAERFPWLVQREVKEGHLVGNHTFSHVTLTGKPVAEIRTEYRACSNLLEEVLGYRPTFCRPPGGDCDPNVVKAGTEEGMTTVMWTDDPGDYKKPGSSTIEQETLRHLCNGGVILLHDGITQTMTVLPQIIAYARRRGYRFVTVDELQEAQGELAWMPH